MKVYSENFMLMETKKVLTCLKYDQRQADIKVEWGWESITKSGHFDTLTRIWHSGGRDGYEDIVEEVLGLISSSSVVDQFTLTLGMFCWYITHDAF